MQPRSALPRARDPSAYIGAAALLLWLVYALPLFVPPATAPPTPPSPDAGLLARVFPGVPAAWVAARLLALAAAALLAAWAAAGAAPRARIPPPSRDLPLPATARARGARLAALLLAAGAAGLAAFASRLDRTLQGLYFLLLVLPAAVLALGAGPPRLSSVSRAAWRRALPVLALAAVWLAWRAWAGWHAPCAADAVDTWLGFQELMEAAGDGRNLITAEATPGVKSTYLVLQGVIPLSAGLLPQSLLTVQLVHLGWLALAGVGVGWLAARWVGAWAAPLATASLLFSPFVLFAGLTATPTFLGPLVATALLVLASLFLWRGAPWALVACAALGGWSLTLPPLAPLGLVVGSGVAWRALRTRARLPPSVLAASALVFAASLGPGLPSPASLSAAYEQYVAKSGMWAGLELVVLGQLPPLAAPELWEAGRPGLLDVPVGSLLAPFAIPRSPLRLWGDALFDPLTAALAAVGILLCASAARRSGAAAWLLVLLAAGLAPGLLTSFDRPSHTRMFAMPVLVALLAAFGLEALRVRFLRRAPAVAVGLVAAVLAAAGGGVLFDAVNPRILPRSWLGIAIRALDDPRTDVAVLEQGAGGADFDWLHARRIATQVPRRPLPVRRYTGPESLRADGSDAPAASVLVWSPALEAGLGVRRAVCARWPEAAIYRLRDPAGVSSVLVASVPAGGWTPRLPPAEWRREGCRSS